MSPLQTHLDTVSAAVGRKQKAWVESFSVAGSMIVGMAAAVVVGLLVK